MKLELEPREQELLAGLVESRIGELHSEIRRSRDYKFHDRLQDDLGIWQALLEKLKNAGAATS